MYARVSDCEHSVIGSHVETTLEKCVVPRPYTNDAQLHRYTDEEIEDIWCSVYGVLVKLLPRCSTRSHSRTVLSCLCDRYIPCSYCLVDSNQPFLALRES